MTCPGFEQLLDYLDGRLEKIPAQAVASHLAVGCEQCTADRAWYEQVKQTARGDDSIEPPSWALKRALRLFNAPPVRTNLGARVGEVVASLVFDSLRLPAVAGARSSGVEGRQLLYRAEDYSIDLQVASADQKRAQLTGQILREGELTFESVAGLQLELLRDGGTILSALTNDRGEFAISSVEFGEYDLRVDANEARITILGVPLAG